MQYNVTYYIVIAPEDDIVIIDIDNKLHMIYFK